MKIAEYNEMMAYLTRPEPLPQPKPEELLDLQEQKRIDRLRKNMEEIGPGLMDESVDFIEREELNIGTRPDNLSAPRENLKRLAEIIQQADIDDELEYLMLTPEQQLKQAKILNRKKIVRHKKGKMTAALRQDFNRLRTDENSIKIVANLLGEDVEYVLDIIDEADNFSGEAKLKAMMSGSRIKEKGNRAKFEKIEKWMTSNAKKFEDPTELKKAINKRFGSNNILNQTVKKNGIPLFTQGFTNEILGLKGFSGDTSKLTNTLLDNIYKTTIYNFNPKVRKELTKEITNVLSGGPAKVTEEARTKIKNNPLLKKFGFDQQINGPIAKLLFKEIGEDMYRNLQTFKQPRFGTDDLLKYLANEVNPKYKSMFTEAGKAIKAFQDRDRDGAAKFLKKGTKIMYDHKIPVSLIKNGYGDEIEYVKLQPTSEYFNAEIKNRQFDQPVNNLLRKYEKATGPKKDILFNQILEKRNDFNKNYANYLKDVSITRDNTGKIKFSTSDKTPVFTKDTDILKEFKKQDSIFKEAGLEKLVASIACSGKAMGGRIGFQDGTSCFEKGKKMINTGNIPEGAAKKNFIKFANKAMEIGKQSGRGLRTIAKFGIIPEAIIIGADTAIRAGMGDTFDEAFKRASDIYRTDKAYEQADASEINRRMNSNDGKLILNLRNFYNEQAKLSSLEQAEAADLALAGDEFNEMNIGMTEAEIKKLYAPRKQEQENNLFNASISDAEERAGLAKETEFADKKGVDYKKSIIGKPLDDLAEVPGFKQVADFFATDVVREPDVGVQALANLFRDRGVPEQKISAFEKGTEKNPKAALELLDYFKSLDAKPLPEGMVRTDRSVADEERSILLELAKTDPALAERYLGFGMTFAGDPIDSTDLQDEMNLDRGIYALGGRIGFKDGPKNPGRRTFIKGMGILAALPFVGKFIKPAAPLVKKLANSNTVMPDWFPNFVDKFIGRSIGKKIDADLMEYTNPDLPNIKLTRKDDGSIFVEGKNEFNEAYNITYEPPGYEVLDYKTGKTVKTKGEFEAVEGRHVALGPEDYDTDAFYADELDELYTSDIADMEKYTTGNVTDTAKDAFGRDTGLKKGMYDSDMAQGRAENQADILADEGLDEID
jgi:hypothetical protein